MSISFIKFYLMPGLVFLFFQSCSSISPKRLLAVGGTHILESSELCKLTSAKPEAAIKDLGWDKKLALEATDEGTAEVLCGNEQQTLEFAKPVRLEIEMVKEKEEEQTKIIVGERVKVKAHLYDQLDRELEVGKFTTFNWTSSDGFEVANDSSAGEFGFCDTCFGIHHFLAQKQGQGTIEVQFGNLQGILPVIVEGQ